MIQTEEIKLETIALRPVAGAFVSNAFDHGVFRATVSDSASENFAWLQSRCNRDKPFANGEKPSVDYKIAIGQLAMLRGLPRHILTDDSEDLEKVFSAAGALASDELAYLCDFVFGDAPSSLEAFLIKKAYEEIDPRLVFDAHPKSEVTIPTVFKEAIPSAEGLFRKYMSRARRANLHHNTLEYIRGTSRETGKRVDLSSSLHPRAHRLVSDWEDQEQLVVKFIEQQDISFTPTEYMDLTVHRRHTNDAIKRSLLDNDNPTEVSRQVSNLLRDLSKLSDPLRF